MAPAPRERWEQRWTLVLAGLAAVGGLVPVWYLPRAMESHGGGAFVLAWLLCCGVLAFPLLWYELALGVVLQAGLPDALRRSDRRWEWLGWWGAGIALVVATLVVSAAAALLHHALRAGVVLATGRLGSVELPADPAVADPAPVGTLVLVAIAVAILATWLGGIGAARLGRHLHRWLGVAIALVALGFVLGISDVGGTTGFVTLLAPDWLALLETRAWLDAAGLALLTVLSGCGILTACGSHRPRTSDVGGSALLILSLVVALHLLAAGAIATIHGRLSLQGLIPPGSDPGLVPVILAEPLSALAPDAPRFDAGVVLAVTLGLGLLLVHGAAVVIHGLVTAVIDRGEVPAGRVAWRLGAWLCLAAIALASPQGLWWQAAWMDALVTWALLPLGAVLGWAAVWVLGTEGIQDHTSAYSTIRPRRWWANWLGVVVPVVAVVLWWGRLMDRAIGEAVPLPEWAMVTVAGVCLVLPAVAYAAMRIGRIEGVVLPRWLAGACLVGLGVAVVGQFWGAQVTSERRDIDDDLSATAERWLVGEDWGPSDHRGHPLQVARRAWRQDSYDQALGALAVWARVEHTSEESGAAVALADDLVEQALRDLSLEYPKNVPSVLASLAMLRVLGVDGTVERVEAAWRVADWVDPEAVSRLEAATAALADPEAGPADLRRLVVGFVGLVPDAPRADLQAWRQAPGGAGVAANRAAVALLQHLADLAADPEVGPRERLAAADALVRTGMWDAASRQQRRWLSAAQASLTPAGPALGVAIAIALALSAIIGWLMRRIATGPGPVDPSADTLEHVEPVDVDSQAVTLEGEYTTTSGDDGSTPSDSRPLPLA